MYTKVGARCDKFAPVRVPTNLENLENLELSGNFVNLEKSGKSQGICYMVREFFYEMSHFS